VPRPVKVIPGAAAGKTVFPILVSSRMSPYKNFFYQAAAMGKKGKIFPQCYKN
jgi:hypothetical protein